jgi:hypothetical protein
MMNSVVEKVEGAHLFSLLGKEGSGEILFSFAISNPPSPPFSKGG